MDEQGKIVSDDFEGEVRRSFENARKILAAAGLDFSHVVQVRNYVARQEDLATLHRLFSTALPRSNNLDRLSGQLVEV